ncbi:hypothetical protein EJB05_11352, partial [Eragrostis curvula]
MNQLSLLHRALHLPRLPLRRRHGFTAVVVRARLSSPEPDSHQQAERLAVARPQESIEAAAAATAATETQQLLLQLQESTAAEDSSRTCALPTLALIGGITAGVAAALALSAGAGPAHALGPEGPLVEEFWDNMRRYALYALTVSTGVAYTVLQPIVELLKNPITALLIIAFLAGTGFFVSQVLNAMVGNSEFIYRKSKPPPNPRTSRSEGDRLTRKPRPLSASPTSDEQFDPAEREIFKVWNTQEWGTICLRPINQKRKLDDLIGPENNTSCEIAQDVSTPKPIHKRRRGNELENLPEDLLGTILSKLPQNEVVKTSILSKKWRYLWAVCPKLRFDGVTMCGDMFRGQQCTQKFIANVNAVLQQYQGKVVEELAIKFGFDSMLVDHLNSWVSFAVTSSTKFLAFDLIPAGYKQCDDRYVFPFELLDSESLSRLQHIQLSFVCLRPPNHFRGFPNLKKLDLHAVRANGKDLQAMLSNCCSLEWLSLVRCLLDDELKVDHPLPCLLYLSVANCRVHKIELDSVKLATFVYEGLMVPIDLSKSSKLDKVDVHFFSTTLKHVITTFPIALPNMQNMTLRAYFKSPQIPCFIENPCKFSQLRHLCLVSSFARDVDTMSLFSIVAGIFIRNDPVRRFPDCLYNHLKDVTIARFEGSKGQLEFLVHLLESAPALELVTAYAVGFYCGKDPPEKTATYMSLIHRIVRRHVEHIPPKCSLRII